MMEPHATLPRQCPPRPPRGPAAWDDSAGHTHGPGHAGGGTTCPVEPKAAGKSPRLTEHTGPVTQHPPLLGAVGGGRLLKGLVKLAVRRQQDRDPLHLHSRDAWGPGKKGWGLGEGLTGSPLKGPATRLTRATRVG